MTARRSSHGYNLFFALFGLRVCSGVKRVLRGSTKFHRHDNKALRHFARWSSLLREG
jgi:hypothetical protein